jgi:hypothetical protein
MNTKYSLPIAVAVASTLLSCTTYHGISVPPGGTPVMLTTCSEYLGQSFSCAVHECLRQGQVLHCREIDVQLWKGKPSAAAPEPGK